MEGFWPPNKSSAKRTRNTLADFSLLLHLASTCDSCNSVISTFRRMSGSFDNGLQALEAFGNEFKCAVLLHLAFLVGWADTSVLQRDTLAWLLNATKVG